MAATPLRVRRQASGVQARRTGRAGEILAAVWLMARGWRILAMNLKTHGVEIDLLARRGGVLAVVEVKARASLDAALAAVTPEQQARLRRAGLALAARPQSRDLALRLDLIALAPGRLPRHVANAWPQGDEGFAAGWRP